MTKPAFKLNRAVCTKDHDGSVPAKRIADLPESQAGAWRHRCAACAYQMGFEDAIKAVRGLRRDGYVTKEKLAALAAGAPKHTHS